MSRTRWIPICCVVVALFVAPAAGAQELYTYTVGLFGGLGGSIDADTGNGVDNGSFQLGVSVVTEAQTRVALRAGRLGLGGGDRFVDLTDARLTYATLAGEYRFQDEAYTPWAYIGLGAYRVSGDRPGGDRSDDTGVGLALGLVGEFTLTRRFDAVVEVSGHYADLDQAKVFAMGHAGVAFHF